MKIVQILPELHGGGVERGTLELGKFLTSQGHQSIVVSNGGRMVSQLETEGTRHIQIPVHRKHLAVAKQISELRRLFVTERPDIVHLRSRLPAWLGWLAWKTVPTPIRPALVTTVHGFYSVNSYSKIMTRGERVICVSDTIRKYVREYYPSVPESRLTVIHRGICPEAYPNGYRPSARWLAQWQENFPQLKKKYVLALPGRITRWKGQLDFIKIVQELKQRKIPVHGLIIGEAHDAKQDYSQAVHAEVHAKGLEDDITFTGFRSDLKEIMAVSNVVVSCSTEPEAFGRVTLEALSLGRPVAAYNHGGVAEQMKLLLPEGMIPPGDTAVMVNTLCEWFKSPPSVTGSCDHPFTLDRFNRSTLLVYQQLLGETARYAA